MTPTETANVLQVLAGAFRTQLGDDTALVWAQLMKPVEYRHGQEVAETVARTQQFFPTPAEFLAGCQALAREDAEADIHARQLQAAYRCDGSRWRCAQHRGKCPPMCLANERDEHGKAYGLEPCPTCNPTTHDRLADEQSNRRWRDGGKFKNDDAPPPPPACMPIHEPVAQPDAQRAARIAADDWTNHRKDVQ